MMRSVLPLAFCLALGACATDPPGRSDDEAALRDLIERTEATNNASDVEGWVALFAEDAAYMPPGAPAVTTRAELIAVAEAGFRHEADVQVEPAEIEVAGDWAFARTRVTGTVTVDGSGEVIPIDVKQIVVYRRSAEGAWQIARMISNRNAS